MSLELSPLYNSLFCLAFLGALQNTVPKLPEQYKNRKIRQKGFKQITVNDFPVRGKKVQLLFRRRVWQIQGVKELYKKEIPKVIFPGTRLEKEFADFLKGGD